MPSFTVTVHDASAQTATASGTITITGGGPALVGAGIDANGWTFFNAPSRTAYVSDSAGNDANSGLTQALPVKTLAKGRSLLRNGTSDALLLKCGDTWLNQELGDLGINGLSAANPILVSSYGTGARPLIKTAVGGNLGVGAFNNNGNNVAVVGLDFYAHARDPASPTYVAGNTNSPTGFGWVGIVSGVLVEDCRFRFYQNNVMQGFSGQAGTIVIRRNVISDNYSINSANAEGLYVDKTNNPVFQDNVFDHNGWNGTIVAARPTIFNHNHYIQDDCGPAIVTGNIYTFGSATGVQVRPGGIVTGNLFVRNPVSFQTGSNQSGQLSGNATVTGNCVLEGSNIDAQNPRGWGLIVYPNDPGTTIQVHSNIFAHNVGTQPIGISLEPNSHNVSCTGNIIYQWTPSLQNNGTNNTIIPNDIDKPGYVDPNRSVATYMTSIGAAPSTLAGFIAAAKNNSKATWDVRYTAAPVINYISAGFV